MSENLVSPITDLLLVYGTLRRGHQNAAANHLHQTSTYAGPGWFSGRLYRIGWFPGAIYDPSAPTRVWGELYRLSQPDLLLAYLDRYEGVNDNPPLFVRRPITVCTEKVPVLCQIYLYARPTHTLPLIDSGTF